MLRLFAVRFGIEHVCYSTTQNCQNEAHLISLILRQAASHLTGKVRFNIFVAIKIAQLFFRNEVGRDYVGMLFLSRSLGSSHLNCSSTSITNRLFIASRIHTLLLYVVDVTIQTALSYFLGRGHIQTHAP